MARRNQTDEIAFGSDSFLDVLANMIGILIILIVIAGLRVSRAPVVVQANVDAEEAVVVAVVEQVEEKHPGPELAPAAAEPEPPPPPLLPPAVPEPPPELVGRAKELRAAISKAGAELEHTRQQSARHARDCEAAERELAAALSATDSKTRSLESDRTGLAKAQTAVDEVRDQLAAVRSQLNEASTKPAYTKVLKHRVTPIGRVVNNDEVHFRLEAGRVSVVPVDALAGELKTRVGNNRDALLKLPRYEGTIGPIEGYKMHYVIERQQVSVLEELRYGRYFVRMAVSFWQMEPQPGVVMESAEEALAAGSRFRRALDAIGPTPTLTFWVYPDSFELCRRLQEHVRGAGFEVAARPLPPGVSISGSPEGSKSVAQ